MTMEDVAKMFMGESMGPIYEEEVIEFESVSGAQHINVY